jgi:hypothetical protein
MSIEAYLAQLAGLLTVAPATRTQILQEVRDHLEDAAYYYQKLPSECPCLLARE